MDLATLSLSLDNAGMLAAIDNTGQSLDALASKGEGAQQRLASTFPRISDGLIKQAQDVSRVRDEYDRVAQVTDTISTVEQATRGATSAAVEQATAQATAAQAIRGVAQAAAENAAAQQASAATAQSAAQATAQTVVQAASESAAAQEATAAAAQAATEAIAQQATAQTEAAEAVRAATQGEAGGYATLGEAQRAWAAETRTSYATAEEAARAYSAETSRVTAQDIANASKRYDAMLSPGDAAKKGREQAQQMAAGIEQQFKLDMARIKEGQVRGFLNDAEARKAGQEAAMSYNQGMIGVLDKGSASQAFLGKEGEASFTKVAGSLKNIEEAGTHAGLGLGRVRQGLTSLFASLSGTSPILDRVGGTLASFAVGSALTIGVVAGITAIAYTWEMLTAKSREAKKALEEYLQTDDARRARSAAQSEVKSGFMGLGSSEQIDIEGPTAAIDKLQKSLKGLRDQMESPGDGGFFDSYIGRANQVNEQLVALRTGYEKGTVSAEQFQIQLLAIAAAHPDYAPQISQTQSLKNVYDELTESLRKATAAEAENRAESAALAATYGPLYGNALQQLDRVNQEVAAFKRGGTVALNVKRGDFQAVDDAAALWRQYTTTVAGAQHANVAFTDALAGKGGTDAKAEAERELGITRQIIAAQGELSHTNAPKQNTGTESLTRFADEIKRMHTEAQSFGRDSSIDNRVQSIVDQLDALERKYPKLTAQVEAYKASVRSVGDEMKAAAYGKAARDIDDQYEAQRALTAAQRDGGTAMQSATQAAHANAEIKRIQLQLGRDLAEQEKQRIRDTFAAKDVQTDVQGTQALLAQVAALKAEDDALRVGADVRATYTINKQADLEITRALTIADGTERAARIAAIEALRRESLEHVALQKTVSDTEAAQKKAAEESAQVWKNAIKQIQSDFANFFDQIFTKGISNFGDLFSEIKNMFMKLIADLLAAELMKKLKGLFDNVMGNKQPIEVSAQQMAAGAVMLSAATMQVTAANVMAAAAGTAQSTGTGAAAANAGAGSAGAAALAAAAGAAVAGGTAGYGIGKAFYSADHGNVQNYAEGGLGGAVVGAAIGSVVPGIGTAVGAIIGGVAGFVGGLLAAKQAIDLTAKSLDGLQTKLVSSLANYKAVIEDDTLTQQMYAAQDQLRQMLSQINAALPGKANETERNADRAAASKLEAEQETRLRAQQAQQTQYATQDYQVRLLRAQGQTKQADDLAFAEKQQREYTAAQTAGADATTLATLNTTLHAEATARATGALGSFTAALTNAPSGFKIALDRFTATIPKAPSIPTAPPIVPGTDGYGVPTLPPMGVLPTPTTPMYPQMPPKAGAPFATPAAQTVNEGDVIFNLTVTSTASDVAGMADEIAPMIYAKLGTLAQRDKARGGASRFTLQAGQA